MRQWLHTDIVKRGFTVARMGRSSVLTGRMFHSYGDAPAVGSPSLTAPFASVVLVCQHSRMTFLVRLVINAFAIWLAAQWITGIDISSSGNGTGWDIIVLLGIALVFTAVNMFVKPLVKLLSLPLLILTLGLFTLVINALMLMLTAWISSQTDYGMTVDGFWTALWGGLIIAIVNFLLSALVPDRD